MISTPWIVATLVIFLAKHLLADFLFQTSWMANGKEQPVGWFAPLAVHAAVHGLATTLIFLVLAPAYIWFGLVDFLVHFAIDRGKGVVTRACDADPTQTIFWWLIGIDQTLHHLTHLVYAVWIAAVLTKL